MNKYQKETEKVLLEHEKELFNQLKDDYAQALADTKKLVREIQIDIDILKKSNPDNESIIQSKIYRLNYQQALENQLSATMNVLNSKNVTNIQSFLLKIAEDSYLGNNYTMQKNGIPIITPINHQLIANIINTPIEDMKFSERLYSNVNELKKKVKSEISRGIAKGSSYIDISSKISKRTEADFFQAYRIARTEGGRVSNATRLQQMTDAQKKGADIVKQWDATLDDKTRDEHAELDQQIREIEEPFEIHGMKAMYPGNFGIASMDINCRCVITSVSKWDIQEENERIDNITGETIKCKNYADWKKKYYNILGVGNDSNTKTTRQFVETISLMNLSIKLKEYENTIYKNNYESAFVIQTNGDVFKFIGDENSVKIYNVDVENAIITHNHPVDHDVYRSFGEDDFDYIKNNNIKRMRIVTPKYEYEIEKIKEIDISYNEIYMEACSKLMVDENLEIQHEAMKILKERGYVKYERRVRESD